jgi:D-glycero-D-manno-heptose 1,7-bisphosphate phosphatase
MPSELRKAVFLDRDGVLIEERGDYTWLLEDFRVNPGVPEALQRLAEAGYLLIVISNQGGIGKGLYTKAEADYLHLHLERQLSLVGVALQEIYYCPHHPASGKCLCRKPSGLMLEKAIARFGLDRSGSFFIGDTDRDIEAGTAAGVIPVRIMPNEPLGPVVSRILLGTF